MLKYLNFDVTFAEIPDEITLCINITGCPNRCEGCHSKFLQEDIGITLYWDNLKKLIDGNKGITCVCFMGGDSDPSYINALAKIVKQNYDIKTAWYSGNDTLNEKYIDYLDYIKVGSYKKELDGLDNPNTNQRLYKIINKEKIDITFKFWKHDNQNRKY